MLRSTICALALLTLSAACALAPTSKNTQPPETDAPAQAPADPQIAALAAFEASVPTVAACAGVPKAAQALMGLAFDHAMMSNVTQMADYSRQATAVEDFKGWFPALEALDLEAVLVTPAAVPNADPLLLVVAMDKDAEVDEEGVIPQLSLTALACGDGGHVVAMEPTKIWTGQALQFRGAAAVPTPDGGFVTALTLMLSSPNISEFGVHSWLLSADAQKATLEGDLERFGGQVLVGMAGEYSRTEPLAGTGWYPGPEGWRFVAMLDTSSPGEEPDQWEDFTVLDNRPNTVSASGAITEPDYPELWLWTTKGPMNEDCGRTLRCIPFTDQYGGMFPWDKSRAFDWMVGAWDSLEEATAALTASGIDPTTGTFWTDMNTIMLVEDGMMALPEGYKVVHAVPNP